jgi:hypothetical protein
MDERAALGLCHKWLLTITVPQSVRPKPARPGVGARRFPAATARGAGYEEQLTEMPDAQSGGSEA